jgi:hypothetical protein
MIPFCPNYSSNQNVTATSTPAIITINRNDNQIRVLNTGSAIAYIGAYDSTGTALVASATAFPVAPGQASTITKSLSHDKISYYSATSSTLSIMTGKGI